MTLHSLEKNPGLDDTYMEFSQDVLRPVKEHKKGGVKLYQYLLILTYCEQVVAI